MASELQNKEFVLSTRPSDQNELQSAWKLQACPMPTITNDNEFIVQTLFVSVDPYLSSGLKKSALGGDVNPIGSVQVSSLVGRVIESKNANFPVETIVTGRLQWKKYNLATGTEARFRIVQKSTEKNTIYDRIGLSTALGVLGIPSQTAYYGILSVANTQPSDVLVVSGAAGAVGTIAGQIAKKIRGAQKVIGIAGGQQKCDYLVNQLGYDAAINYKEYNTKEKMINKLKELAPEGITQYFDNTGEFVTDAIFDIIKRHGKIIICGQISTYNNSEDDPAKVNIYPNYLAKTVYRGLSILGFAVSDFIHRSEEEFYKDMPIWLDQGTIQFQETFVDGFENLPRAYEMLYTGETIGKVVVRV
jgi:NADPH-dependent curcumin reductase CurA